MNFCPSCGEALAKNAKFCSSCGFSIQELSSQNNINETAAAVSVEHTAAEAPPKKRIPKMWMMIAVIAVVLLGGGSAFAFFMMKSPMAMYLLAEQKSFKQLQSDWDETYGDLTKYQQLLLKKPSINEVNISGNIEMPSDEITSEIEMIQEFLSKAAIKIKSEQDPIEQISKVNMGIELDSAKAFNVELHQSKEIIGLKVPILSDKSFYLNTNKYGEFMRMIDPYYEGPEKLDFNNKLLEELEFTDEEKNYLIKRYRTFLLSELKEEMFTLNKGVSIKQEGQTMKTNEITLKLSEEQTKSLISKWIDHLIEDDELHNMIANRVVKIDEFGQFGQSMEMQLSGANVKKEFKKALAEKKNGLNDLSIPEGFKSVVNLDKKGQIMARNMEISIGDEYSTLDFKFSSKNIALKAKGDRDKEWKVVVTPQDRESSNLIISSVNNIREQNDGKTEKLKVNLFLEDSGEVLSDVTVDVNSTFKEYKNGKLDVKRDFQVSSNPDVRSGGSGIITSIFPMSEFQIKGTIDQRSETDIKKEFSNQTFGFALILDDGYQSGKVKLTVDSKSKIDNALKISLANDENGLNILKLTEDDMYNLQEEFAAKLMTLAEELGLNESGYSFFDDFDDYDSYDDDTDLYDEEYTDYDYDDSYNEDESSYDDEYAYEDEEEIVYQEGYKLYSQTCLACHGQNLEGGVGPSLSGVGSYLYAEDIYEIIMNGQGAMPAGLLDEDSAADISLWLVNNFY